MMEYSNDRIDKALDLLEKGIHDEVMEEVKRELRGGEDSQYYASIGIRTGAGTSPLDVDLVWGMDLMRTINIRDEMLEHFGDDPEGSAEEIKATAAELRALANELEALQS